MGASFAFYLLLIKKINVNISRVPSSSSGQALVLIFLGLLIAILYTLFLFWTKLNLLETLSVLGVLLIPTFIVGNYALLSLKDERKEKI